MLYHVDERVSNLAAFSMILAFALGVVITVIYYNFIKEKGDDKNEDGNPSQDD